MNTILAFSFTESRGGGATLEHIRGLERRGLLRVLDAVVVRADDGGNFETEQMHNLVAQGAVSGGALGAFVGVLLLHPLIGMAAGAALGAASGATRDIGVDDDFVRELSKTLKPEHSALFLQVDQLQPERVLEELRGLRGEVIHTSFDPERDQRWRQALRGHHPGAGHGAHASSGVTARGGANESEVSA